ncbi:MAG: ABC transporter substrate-binding protein, partial [Gemmatimonadetes bacterium]|nr:ABC transporter substrate-binding protein [Gemmatimonadota bacterium]
MNKPQPATAKGEGREDPGFSDGHVLFGQSAALTGPARELGHAMRLGIEAAFHEANQGGGVYGRELQLKVLDDGYETYFA